MNYFVGNPLLLTTKFIRNEYHAELLRVLEKQN